MVHVHFFQLNIPSDNHRFDSTDHYLNVIAKWSGSFYSDGRPMIIIKFIELNSYDLISVINWNTVVEDAEKLAENHFADIAKAERINKARAELISLGESGNPIMDRLTVKEVDFLTEKTLS